MSLAVVVLRDFPQVYVLSDEIYEYLIIEKGKEFVSLASMPGMKERTIVGAFPVPRVVKGALLEEQNPSAHLILS